VVLVFDVGGTNTRLALAESGALKDVVRVPTDRGVDGLAKFVRAIKDVVGDGQLTAVAGGLPVQLAGEDGEVVLASYLPGWLGKTVVAQLRDELGCPVYVANDTALCGLGECTAGAGTRAGVMAYYTVSTGVNGVRLVDGKVDSTVGRYELGKQIVGYSGQERRSLESLVGGAALEKRLGKAPHDVRQPEVWRELERYLAAGLYNTALYWNPSVIVLGGPMMRDIELERVADELKQFPAVLAEWPQLVAAALHDEAGLYGALAWLEQLGAR
jgi:predicted NBD/HSP70 family sugar kinase